MSIDSFFETPSETIGWGKEAIEEIKVAFRAFCSDRENLREIKEVDLETGYETVKVKVFKPLPSTIRRKFTEALCNIRHSFDQSVYGACWAIGKRPKDSIYFPWATTPTDMDARLGANSSKPPKIPCQFWPTLRGFEPYFTGNGYSGGKDVIRSLAKIANRKHTVSLQLFPNIAGTTINDLKVETIMPFHIPMPVWDSVNNEVVIFKQHPSSKFSYNYTVEFHITLNEASPLNGIPAIGALEVFLEEAETVRKGLMAVSQTIISQ